MRGGYALPQILLMENVPQVIGGGAIADFVQWREFLERLGYKNYYRLMNAKDYGIPQNRNRCFMISILGDYYYTFPAARKLQYRLKDYLDRNVEEKYYLSDTTIEMFMEHTARQQEKGNGFKFEPTTGGGTLKQSAPEPEEERTTILLSNKTTKLERTTTAVTICARDHKGLGNQAMNAVVERGGGDFGITVGKSAAFQRGPLPGVSRTIDTNGTNGVILWTKQNANK